MKIQAKALSVCVAAILAVSLFCSYSYAASTEKDAILKGIELSKVGKNDEAIAEFNKAISIKPNSAEAYYNRGFIYYREGSMESAIVDYSKVIELDPAFADAYHNRGLAYYKKGNFDLAIADYNKAMELTKGASDALYGRGLAYYKKNDIKQAIADFDKVIEMRPDFPLAYSARAIAYFSMKNYGKTLEDVNKAVSLGFRMRPLKEPPVGEAPEKSAITEKAQAYNVASILEKVRMTPSVKDPAKLKIWREKRLANKIKFYALSFSLIICLIVILVLLRKNNRCKR